MNKYLSVGEAAEMLGVSVPTVRRWQKAGKIQESHRTIGNHRRFSIQSLRALLGINFERKVVGYARVSSHDQKADLITQAEFLKSHGCDEVISDLGSGMNCRKRGLIKLLKLIVSGKVERLVLSHQDRLLRFGHELVFNLCQWFNVDVQIIHAKEDESFEVELTKDVITLMTVFSARLYGKRSHKKRKKLVA
ncbi:IS607 family transposase [Vibrio breoganii]|uniref:IS607 family transposase n=1 Tax=Vibrio breoganii TaxID=553239 RepID=UPI000C814793|nr:IS607 family transposase [Vibrio breoganii]